MNYHGRDTGFKKGQLVKWTDPDNGIGSGDYTIISKIGDVILIKNEYSEVEVYSHELELIA